MVFIADPLPLLCPRHLQFCGSAVDPFAAGGAALSLIWPRWVSRLRPRNIDEQRKHMAGRMPLGMVFHLVPSNVPTVAFYSWLMALLTGNSSVVRLSSRIDPMVRHAGHPELSCFNNPGGALLPSVPASCVTAMTRGSPPGCRIAVVCASSGVAMKPSAGCELFRSPECSGSGVSGSPFHGGARQSLAGRAGARTIAASAVGLAAGLYPLQSAGVRFADHPSLAGRAR